MDRLSTAKVYIKPDIRNAYHRPRITEGDEWKTAFRTKYGLFEYTVMSFGLTNAPASFQGLINDTLREFLDLFVVVYLDDILIYSENLTDHYNHVSLVLENFGMLDFTFVWSTEADQSFQQLKTALILHHFDPSSNIIIETDGSDFAIAGVLSQYSFDDLLHPVAFYSRKLKTTEANYDIYDKELLTAIEYFKTWRHYLQGASHQITVYIDHKNLEYFATTNSLN
ncbi:hypothetical protein G6F44_009223 [Rhizopus delemar]|nr:hypothetical protein G6F44_009223 [Rhizopus delemar]